MRIEDLQRKLYNKRLAVRIVYLSMMGAGLALLGRSLNHDIITFIGYALASLIVLYFLLLFIVGTAKWFSKNCVAYG